MYILTVCALVFEGYGDHRDLHVLTHSFPTRRSSDLRIVDDRAIALAQPHRRFVADHVHIGGDDAREQVGLRSAQAVRSEEHTSELQSLMRNSYAVFCLKKKKEHVELHTDLLCRT